MGSGNMSKVCVRPVAGSWSSAEREPPSALSRTRWFRRTGRAGPPPGKPAPGPRSCRWRRGTSQGSTPSMAGAASQAILLFSANHTCARPSSSSSQATVASSGKMRICLASGLLSREDSGPRAMPRRPSCRGDSNAVRIDAQLVRMADDRQVSWRASSAWGRGCSGARR